VEIELMDARSVIRFLRAWWWMLLLGVVASGGITYYVTQSTPSTYLARTTLLVGSYGKGVEVTDRDVSTAQTLADVYAALAVREPVLSGALTELGLKEWSWESLRDRLAVRVPSGSSLIELSVVDTDPLRAQAFAQAVARQVIRQSAVGPDEASRTREFTLAQMDDLQGKLTTAQAQVRALDDEVTRATSARDIADRRSRIAALQAQIGAWQDTYSSLQRNLLDASPNVIQVIEPASLPTTPIGPRATNNAAAAALIGLIIAAAAAFGIETIDDTIKSPDDARATLGLSVLGSVARRRGAESDAKPIALTRDHFGEAFRVLRTNLQFSAAGAPLQTLLVTSTRPKEGKSMTAANLATVFAQAGRRTLLIDADLRRPTQHTIFGLDGARGFTTLFLEDGVPLDDVARSISPDLFVLPCGPIPHNPAELLDSTRMASIMALCRSRFDFVVFDAPPVLSVADASILAARVDGVLMVVDAGYTRRAQAVRARETLKASGARLLGVVVNRVRGDDPDDYYYTYPATDAQKTTDGGPQTTDGGLQTAVVGRKTVA
jgi:non-specific protein-tyrosine kinase